MASAPQKLSTRVLLKMRTVFTCGSILIRLANRREYLANVSL
jgi:hypothetical protein